MAAIRRLMLDWFRLVRSARARPYLVVTLIVDCTLVFVFLVALQSYLPEDRGYASLPGYALAAYGAAKLVGQLFGGGLTDRLGANRAVVVGLTIIAVAQALLFLGTAFPVAVIPASVVYGLGGAVLWPAIYAMAAAEFESDERARLTSALTISTGVALGIGLGLGFLLPPHFPYAVAVAVSFAMAVVAVAVGITFLRRGRTGGTVVAGQPGAASLVDIARTLLRPQRLGFAAIVLLDSAALAGLIAVFRAYGRDVIGVSFREELLLLAPAAALGGGAVVLGGALSHRMGRIPLLGSGFLVAGLTVWCLSFVTDPEAVILLAAAGALGLGLAIPSVGAMSMDLSRATRGGLILGLLMTAEGLGHAGGPALAAWLSAKVGVAPVLWIAGGLLVGVSLVALIPPIWAGA